MNKILQRDDLQLAFVWNRTVEALRGKVDDAYILENLSLFAERYFPHSPLNSTLFFSLN